MNNNWKQNLENLCVDSCIAESKILINIPQEYHSDWDNFMRGKTCPLLDNGDHGVYSWDLKQFLTKI